MKKNKSGQTWFYGEATGLNKDIERHAEKEKDLKEKIKNSEGVFKKAYQNLLVKLRSSKVRVTEKIGVNRRKK